MFHVKQEPTFISNSNCPACGNAGSDVFLTCKDYTYSQLDFTLVKCKSCGLVYTNPRPCEEENGNYYKSADYISHTNSTKGLIGFLYKWARKINLKRKIGVLKKHQSGKAVLDVGCGTGFFPKAAMEAGYTATGVEPDADALRFALDVNKIQAFPLEELPKFNSSFDTVTMWHVLEHVYHLRDQLAVITRLIKPGGLFIIALPNYESFDARHYNSNWAGYDVPRHLYHFNEKTVSSLLEQYGFTLQDVLPMKFDAYYVSMLSEQYKGSSKLKGLLNGFKSNRSAAKKQSPYSSQIYVFKNKH